MLTKSIFYLATNLLNILIYLWNIRTRPTRSVVYTRHYFFYNVSKLESVKEIEELFYEIKKHNYNKTVSNISKRLNSLVAPDKQKSKVKHV